MVVFSGPYASLAATGNSTEIVCSYLKNDLSK